jgi:hypothetical protein
LTIVHTRLVWCFKPIYTPIIDTKISSIYNSSLPILDGLHAHHIMFLGMFNNKNFLLMLTNFKGTIMFAYMIFNKKEYTLVQDWELIFSQNKIHGSQG